MAKLNIKKINEICGNDLNTFQVNGICIILKEFEDTLRAELDREYENKYSDKFKKACDCFIISIAFVLHFSEKLRLGKKRLNEVLTDIVETVELFNKKGGYTPKEYQKMLKDDGIPIKMSWDEE